MTSNELQCKDQEHRDSTHELVPLTHYVPNTSIPGFGPDRYDGLDIIQVIPLLRKRLNWSTNVEEIVNEQENTQPKDFNQAGKTIRKMLYSLPDDGVFAYAIVKELDNPTARYNPYDLVCVGAAQTFNSKQLFTVTASAVTQVGILT